MVWGEDTMRLSNKAPLAGAVLLAAISATPAHAEVAIGATAGTLGLGLEGTIGLNDYLSLRIPLHLFSFSFDANEDDIDYDGKLKLKSAGLQLDYHPFKGTFFVSGGAFLNGNKLDLFASDDGDKQYEIGDRAYTGDPNDPLKLKGKLDFGSVAPYVGLGWGNAIQGTSNVYFRFELGALFQGSGDTHLAASGSAVDVQTGQSFDVQGSSAEATEFRAQLENERQSVQHDVDKYDVYPVVSFALGYRFGR
jgi:hypothetical protein